MAEYTLSSIKENTAPWPVFVNSVFPFPAIAPDAQHLQLVVFIQSVWRAQLRQKAIANLPGRVKVPVDERTVACFGAVRYAVQLSGLGLGFLWWFLSLVFSVRGFVHIGRRGDLNFLLRRSREVWGGHDHFWLRFFLLIEPVRMFEDLGAFEAEHLDVRNSLHTIMGTLADAFRMSLRSGAFDPPPRKLPKPPRLYTALPNRITPVFPAVFLKFAIERSKKR